MTPYVLAVLAQGAQPDPLSGGAGWVGAGLLGGVLAWLMFWHLPAKDKQLDALLEKKDRQIDGQRKEFVSTLGQMMGSFRAEAACERAACERHFETLAQSMNQAFKTLGDQLSKQAEEAAAHSHRNQQWIDMMKKEIEARRADPEGKK